MKLSDAKKIGKVFLELCDVNLKVLLIYRASFLISFIIMGIWAISFVILIVTIFEHTETLAGFQKGEVLLILSFYYFFQNISEIFYKDNFESFSDVMRRGLFDLRLVKPVPIQFFTFFYTMRFDHLSGVIITIILFIYSLQNIAQPISPHLFLVGILIALISAWLYFSILLIIATFAFWISKNDTFNVLMWHLSQVSRYPRQIYRNVFQKIFTFGLPLALLAALPAEFALNVSSIEMVMYFLAVTVVFSFLSTLFWNHGLKRYTSAG